MKFKKIVEWIYPNMSKRISKSNNNFNWIIIFIFGTLYLIFPYQFYNIFRIVFGIELGLMLFYYLIFIMPKRKVYFKLNSHKNSSTSKKVNKK